jgi:hypothetical protein
LGRAVRGGQKGYPRDRRRKWTFDFGRNSGGSPMIEIDDGTTIGAAFFQAAAAYASRGFL